MLDLNSRAGEHEAIILCRPGIAESGVHPVATKGADPDQSRFVHHRIGEQGFAHASKPAHSVDVMELELSLRARAHGRRGMCPATEVGRLGFPRNLTRSIKSRSGIGFRPGPAGRLGEELPWIGRSLITT